MKYFSSTKNKEYLAEQNVKKKLMYNSWIISIQNNNLSLVWLMTCRDDELGSTFYSFMGSIISPNTLDLSSSFFPEFISESNSSAKLHELHAKSRFQNNCLLVKQTGAMHAG